MIKLEGVDFTGEYAEFVEKDIDFEEAKNIVFSKLNNEFKEIRTATEISREKGIVFHQICSWNKERFQVTKSENKDVIVFADGINHICIYKESNIILNERTKGRFEIYIADYKINFAFFIK